MVAGASQAKLFEAYIRLLPASPSSRPPPSLSSLWPRSPERAWDKEGVGGRRMKKDRTVGLRARCGAPLQQQSQTHEGEQQQLVEDEDWGIMCEPCNGRGWLLCDFCKGQKTNVKTTENNRIYRRCPSCRAIGYILCSNCKVFKCVTFPDYGDGVM